MPEGEDVQTLARDLEVPCADVTGRTRRAADASAAKRSRGFEHRYCAHPRDRWKFLKELFQGGRAFQVVDQVRYGNARAGKAEGSTHDLGIALDEGSIHGHLLRKVYCGQLRAGLAQPSVQIVASTI